MPFKRQIYNKLGQYQWTEWCSLDLMNAAKQKPNLTTLWRVFPASNFLHRVNGLPIT